MSMDGANHDETSLYNELFGFLKSDRSDLRIAAMQAIMKVDSQQLTQWLFRDDNDDDDAQSVVKILAKSSSHPDPMGITALQALSHLLAIVSQVEAMIHHLVRVGALERMSEICLSSSSSGTKKAWKQRVNLAMGLLANMTRTERGAVELVGRTLPDEAVISSSQEKEDNGNEPSKPTLELLLSRFLSTSYINDEDDEKDNETTTSKEKNQDMQSNDPYQHFAAVLMNATQTKVGRSFCLKLHHRGAGQNKETTPTFVLKSLLPQLKSPNPLRRRGIAGTIKNCLLLQEQDEEEDEEKEDHSFWRVRQNDDDENQKEEENVILIDFIRHLLYPLAGPEELTVDEKRGLDPDLWLEGPDKVREPDTWTRLYLVECLLLLCASGRDTREVLRLERTYVILKWADMVEEDETISERIHECVQFLRRDEEGTAEGSSDRRVEMALSTTTTTAMKNEEEEDLDELD